MLGKLGEFLNKDMGALVKDAGKVLNSDVGALAKGAGKVLNADLGVLLRDQAPGATGASEATAATIDATSPPANASASASAERRDKTASRHATTQPVNSIRAAPAGVPLKSPTPQMSAPKSAVPAPANFDADSTLKLAPGGGNDATLALAPGGGSNATGLPQLPDELVTRHNLKVPSGTSLSELLPHVAGEFERPRATPVGELTSDPVTAMYGAAGHPVALRLMQCWDEDEAREQLTHVKTQAGKNFRMGADKSWILGETLQGMMFAWTRGNYAYTATAPKGEISMLRFLKAFPY